MLNANEMGSSTKSTSLLAIITFISTAILIAIIGMLIFTENSPPNAFFGRGEYFWGKLIWCEVLFFSAWYFGLQCSFKSLLGQRQQTGGAIPVISYSILSTVFFSYLILLISLFVPNVRIYNVLLFIAQLIVIVICLWKVMVLSYSRNLQNDGIVPIPEGVKTPASLVVQLALIEKSFFSGDSSIPKRVKILREKINYSLPSIGKISSSEKYIMLVSKIEVLTLLSENGVDEAELVRELNEMEGMLSHLISELNH